MNPLDSEFQTPWQTYRQLIDTHTSARYDRFHFNEGQTLLVCTKKELPEFPQRKSPNTVVVTTNDEYARVVTNGAGRPTAIVSSGYVSGRRGKYHILHDLSKHYRHHTIPFDFIPIEFGDPMDE